MGHLGGNGSTGRDISLSVGFRVKISMQIHTLSKCCMALFGEADACSLALMRGSIVGAPTSSSCTNKHSKFLMMKY